MVKSGSKVDRANKAANNTVKINDQFSMKKLFTGKRNSAEKFEKFLTDVEQAVSSLFPLHVFIIHDSNKFTYERAIKKRRPRLPKNFKSLSEVQQIETKSEYDQDLKTHAGFVRDLDKEKPGLFALLLSLLSKESRSRVKQHKSWGEARDLVNNHFDPAVLMNIIKATHQNGMLAIDEDIRDVKREFKYTIYSTRQGKSESLFDYVERVIALQDRDKAICASDPLYDSADHVPIIPEADYAALIMDKLNDANSDIRADYINQKRLKAITSFQTIQEARDFIDSYERSKQLIDQREEVVSRSEFTVLKSTMQHMQSVLSGNSEEAKVLLSKSSNSKKRRKSASDNTSTGVRKPTRACKHCEKLNVSTDRMHWDRECPIAAYIASNDSSGQRKGDSKDRPKAGGKKRKQGYKPKVDKDDDDDDNDASDDDDSEDNIGNYSSFVERKSKKSKKHE